MRKKEYVNWSLMMCDDQQCFDTLKIKDTKISQNY